MADDSNGTNHQVRAHPGALAVLHSPFRRLFPGMCSLSFVGRSSGRSIELPVQYAQSGTRLVVYVGDSATKDWWRNFLDVRDVSVHLAGADRHGTGRIVEAGHVDRGGAEQVYRDRYPRIGISSVDPMVVIDLATPDSRPA